MTDESNARCLITGLRNSPCRTNDEGDENTLQDRYPNRMRRHGLSKLGRECSQSCLRRTFCRADGTSTQGHCPWPATPAMCWCSAPARCRSPRPPHACRHRRPHPRPFPGSSSRASTRAWRVCARCKGVQGICARPRLPPQRMSLRCNAATTLDAAAATRASDAVLHFDIRQTWTSGATKGC